MLSTIGIALYIAAFLLVLGTAIWLGVRYENLLHRVRPLVRHNDELLDQVAALAYENMTKERRIKELESQCDSLCLEALNMILGATEIKPDTQALIDKRVDQLSAVDVLSMGKQSGWTTLELDEV